MIDKKRLLALLNSKRQRSEGLAQSYRDLEAQYRAAGDEKTAHSMNHASDVHEGALVLLAELTTAVESGELDSDYVPSIEPSEWDAIDGRR